jgi:hypothetical protein
MQNLLANRPAYAPRIPAIGWARDRRQSYAANGGLESLVTQRDASPDKIIARDPPS